MRLARVAFASILTTCGGELSGTPPGYVDDAGAFHGPDGSVEFYPGSACVAYDAATFSHAGVVFCTGKCSTDYCMHAILDYAPPGYPAQSEYNGNAENECSQPALSSNAGMKTDRVPCTVGASGDAYCQAFYDQFVRGNGHVEVTCQGVCAFSMTAPGTMTCTPDPSNGACTPAGSCTTCDGLYDEGCPGCGALPLSVTRADGGTNREPPCL